MRTTKGVTREEFHAIASLFMSDDYGDDSVLAKGDDSEDEMMRDWLDAQARQLGYDNWVDAYHFSLEPPEPVEADSVAPSKHQWEPDFGVDGAPDDARERIRIAVTQAIGTGSVCWDNLEGVGVFRSEQALDVADGLLHYLFDVEGL